MFRVEAEQRAEDGPGWCRLRLFGLGESSDRIELVIRGPGATRPYLGRSDWEESETWLEFPAETEGETLMTRLGPPYTLRLGKVTTVEIRARVPGGVEERTRLAWPRIVLPAANDATLPGPSEPSSPTAQPEEPVPTASIDLRVAEDDRGIVTGGSHRGLLVAALLMAMAFLGAVGGGAWYLLAGDRSKDAEAALPPPAEATPPAPADPIPARSFTEAAVRAFLATNPEGPPTAAEATLYEEAGHPDLALLLYRHAARRGDPQASAAIGRMYDPDGFDPKKSAFAVPDADQAASYYEPAAEAGDAEAQFRLGRLLLSGRTAGEGDAERGVVWLRRAADQGYAEARAALERLQQQVE